MRSDVPPRGVFVGLATLDIIHRVERAPERNEKITAAAQFVAAGGPAANAAVTFAALGGEAILVTALGAGPVAQLIRSELEAHGVTVRDAAPTLDIDAPVSSVAVLMGSGERSVVGGDAATIRVPAPDPALLDDALTQAAVVLLDGHHPALARAASAAAHARRVPVVLDAGRWKPVMADLIESATAVVASADFRTPGADSTATTADALVAGGAPLVVTTAGADPVSWWADGAHGTVSVPEVLAVDTLGAGDVFHGAFAATFTSATKLSLAERVAFASRVAAIRCAHVGPRGWIPAVHGLTPTTVAARGDA